MVNQPCPTVELAKQLINRSSITPEDNGCQQILIDRLIALGFTVELLPFGKVKNFWAKRGTQQPLFVFAGHTDVVPPGPLTDWITPPFRADIRTGKLYGRGAADMKSSLAAMVVACENFVAKFPQHSGSIAFLITSDEEGAALDGTKKVIEQLLARQEKLTWCLLGEASSVSKLGDTLKIGRRGSLNGQLIVQGKQGHIAYPALAENPIHKALAALIELVNHQWDNSNRYFPATSLQISNITAGTGVTNVIPGQLTLQFNFRYSTENTAESLQTAVNAMLNKHNFAYTLTWRHSGQPFLTEQGELLTAAQKAIQAIVAITPQLSTDGGTSDGRFIATTGCQVIELGPCNETIHQINECVKVTDLALLTKIYQRILELLLC